MFEDGLLMWGCVFGLIFMMFVFGTVNRVFDLFGKTLNRGAILAGIYLLVQKKLPGLPELPKKREDQVENPAVLQPIKEKQPEDIN